jgi:hypothetical protein
MRFAPFLLALLLVPVVAASGFSQEPDRDDERRERVLNAINRGQRALISSQNRNGSWTPTAFVQYEVGLTGLATLALLNSGLEPEHDAVQKALEYLRRSSPTRTYDISMAIMALAASGQPGMKGKIARLASQLEEYQHRGASGGSWGYQGEQGWWDNSNAQFAILALREAAYAGVPIERDVWRRAQQHFLRTQIGAVEGPNGAGWSYKEHGTVTGSMTVAGLASLAITSSMLEEDGDINDDGTINCCGDKRSDVEEAIEASVRWLSRHFSVRSNPGAGNWKLYYLYGLERAGRFSGRRFFNDHDWYREGADFLVAGQNPRTGGWVSDSERDETVGTSLALLFLSKGLSPVLINKLKFGPRDQQGEVVGNDWNRHPRDITNLTDYVSGLPQWPNLLSWQVVDLRTATEGEGVGALLQSPIQYLGGSERPDAIQGRELELLRKYLIQGGFIFAVQNCENSEFDEGFHDLVRRLFDGQHELRKLPPTHDVYRSEHVFSPDDSPPELWGVDFGCRTAIIYAPYDHACRWNKWMKHDPPNRPAAAKTQIDKSMKLGVNVIAYATGRELKDKLDRPEVLSPAELNRMSRGRLTIARLRHTGGWDTAPNALQRLQSALGTVGIEAAPQTPNLAATDSALFDFPLVYMHGRKNFQLSEEERDKLLQYLSHGGFLFADACCGAQQFDASFRQMIEQMFGQPLERIPAEHEIFNMELGHDIRRVKRRLPSEDPRASSLANEESVGEAILEGIQIDGKYIVVYSKYDLSCALERQATSACAGYVTEDAARIGVNLVLYGLFQ